MKTNTKQYTQTDLEDFINGYLIAACWADSAEEEDWCLEQITEDSKDIARKDCEKFLIKAYDLLKNMDRPTEFASIYKAAGFDFWLTVRGHGCGFMDGSWPDTGDQLTKICDEMLLDPMIYKDDEDHIQIG